MNPFESPNQVSKISDLDSETQPPRPPVNQKKFLVRWVILVAVNSIVPLLAARELATPNCFPAIVSALIFVAIGGAIVLTQFPGRQKSIILGSYLLGISQLFPVIQLICGGVASMLCRSLGIGGAYDLIDEVRLIESPPMAAAVTIVTACLLAVVAILSGTVIEALASMFRRTR